MTDAIAQACPVPDQLLCALRDSTSVREDGEALRRRLNDDGYLFLREIVDGADVSAARGEVLERLAEVGEIRQPAIEGIATGESRRRERSTDLGEFWRCVASAVPPGLTPKHSPLPGSELPGYYRVSLRDEK